MKQWLMYFRLECKRMVRTLPALLAGMLMFLVVISGILVFSQTVLESNRKEFQVINVGIVGSEQEKYTKLAISMIEQMDTVQYSAKFTYCTEEEADEGLEEGNYDVIFIIPEDYVKAFMHGENKSIIARFGKGQTGVTSYVMKQLSDFATNLLIQSEKNIYSMQDYYRDIAPEEEDRAVIDINLEYLRQILARGNVFVTEEITRTDGLPMLQYYFCDAILLIFLFLGLQCAKLLQKNHPDFERKMAVTGVGAAKQILSKLAAFCITFFLIYIILGILILIGLPVAEQKGVVLIEGDVIQQIGTLLKIALILIPVCSFIMLVYEIFEESVNGILLLFVVSVALAFIAGCFYPLSFLPQQLQYLSQFTITRAVFSHIADCISSATIVNSVLIMLTHTVLLILIAIMIRYKNIKNKS